ncbi:MAG TPA: DMT family transporter [Parvularculaceae bacterium]|nr:DMT family transporter [Amphiplicatus sp.]MCB9955659.1 DMT family transporter [Caulobacterales bacterium]HOP19729.1 DMT family transporter [Amphiplicatus sp.]HPE31023.1 DMT family transporter [Parvularculaceae bacterium]HRX39362.1 DMT family transporter [Parvularculaceae bacterium]
MSRRSKRIVKGPAAAQPFDWALLAALTAIGSSSFAFIKTGVATIPPGVIAIGRLWVGAIVLYFVMRLGGRRLPPLIVKTSAGYRLHLSWAWMLSVSAIGYVVPFFIFPWAQQFVETGLAGIYMAFMPIWTLGLAYLFANERLGAYKIAGFALGLAGVFVLIGFDALSGAAHANLLAQAGLLLATLCYAISVILSRRTPAIRPRVFACGTVLGAAILATPGLFFVEIDPSTWSLPSILSIFALGVGPTGIAGLIIIVLVRRAGPGFMALANYINPICAVTLGALLFGERLGPNVLGALALILLGVAISQRKPRPQIQPQIESVP